MGNLLSVKDLSVGFQQNKQVVSVVKEVCLEISENEITGLVGDSGSGKTITTLAVTRILPPNARITSGEAIFEGSDLLKMQEEQLRAVRGRKIAYIFQEPTMFLNPIRTCGSQIAEAVTAQQSIDKISAQRKAIELLGQVSIPSPEIAYFNYPHQLSGGMNQRVMIAQALALNPRLLIADEPTTNLDVDTGREILELILSLQKEIGFSCLFITHNLGLVKRLCQRVYVMYKGQIVEEGDLDRIFTAPRHEHTKALMRAYLRLGDTLPIGSKGVPRLG
jgi:ABC-type dipeptide/oligopeptide/nickel transport system ATPase component